MCVQMQYWVRVKLSMKNKHGVLFMRIPAKEYSIYFTPTFNNNLET